MARTDACVLAFLPPNMLCTRFTENHNVTVSINISSESIGLVEDELGWVASAEGHFEGLCCCAMAC